MGIENLTQNIHTSLLLASGLSLFYHFLRKQSTHAHTHDAKLPNVLVGTFTSDTCTHIGAFLPQFTTLSINKTSRKYRTQLCLPSRTEKLFNLIWVENETPSGERALGFFFSPLVFLFWAVLVGKRRCQSSVRHSSQSFLFETKCARRKAHKKSGFRSPQWIVR